MPSDMDDRPDNGEAPRSSPPPIPEQASTITSSATGSSRKHKLHVHETEDEFGEVKDAKIALVESEGSDGDLDVDESGEVRSEGVLVLMKRLVRQRHMKQYFKDGILFRESHTRKVGMDELFLDLIVVANVAAIGHELRGSFAGWLEVEKFFLLYQAIWFAWRDNAFLWNLFSNVRDLIEKIGVLLMVAFLCGIGLGAHDAFGDATRWVSLSAFLASFHVNFGLFAYTMRDPIQGPSLNPKRNFASFLLLFSIPAMIPYIAAAIIGSGHSRTIRILWWISFGLNMAKGPAQVLVSRRVFAKTPGRISPAVNIESYTEKYGLLTIIVIGESLLAILFEASEILSEADLGRLYLSAFLAVMIAFSLFTLYFDVDHRIMDEGVHAIRHNAYQGIVWSQLHLFFQALLIIGATGLGLTFDEASLREGTEVERIFSIRAEEGGEKEKFETRDRWLFCAGVSGSLFILLCLVAMHKPSPHATSKYFRWGSRIVTGTIVLLLPLAESRLPALGLLAVVAVVVALQTAAEFVLVEVDHLRFHGWKMKTQRNTGGGDEAAVKADLEEEDEEDEDDGDDGVEELRFGGGDDDLGLNPCVYKRCSKSGTQVHA